MSCMNNIDPYNNAPPPRNNGGLSDPPKVSSQRPSVPHTPDPQTMIQMLQSDLNTAISYIRQIGGQWPPPGH